MQKPPRALASVNLVLIMEYDYEADLVVNQFNYNRAQSTASRIA